jgi:hypothetical protein
LRLDVEEGRYEKKGARAEGVVLSKTVYHRSSKRSRYYVSYRFTTREGKTIQGRDDVFPNTYHKLREGGPIEIEYLSDSPDTNRIPGESAKSSTYANIGRFLLLSSAFLLLTGFRKTRAALRLRRDTTVTDRNQSIR